MADDLQRALDALKSSGSGGGSSSSKKSGGSSSYLGMPSGYTPPDFFQPAHGTSRENPADKPTPFAPRPEYFTSGSELAITGWSTERIAALQYEMARVGLIGPKTKFRHGMADDTTVNAYRTLLSTANRNGTNIQGALDLLASHPKGSVAGGFGDAPSGPVTTTRTDTSTTHFDDLDARALANDTYSSALGRAANSKESAALQAALNAYAQAHPSVSTTRQTVQPDGDMSTNTTSRGGISAQGVQQLAQDEAMADPDYAETQAAMTYFPELQRMLGPTANVQGR